MSLQSMDTHSVARVPDPNSFIIGRRGKVCAIRRPREAVYTVCMPAQDGAQDESWHGRATNFGEGRGFGIRLWLFRFLFAHTRCSEKNAWLFWLWDLSCFGRARA